MENVGWYTAELRKAMDMWICKKQGQFFKIIDIVNCRTVPVSIVELSPFYEELSLPRKRSLKNAELSPIPENGDSSAKLVSGKKTF